MDKSSSAEVSLFPVMLLRQNPSELDPPLRKGECLNDISSMLVRAAFSEAASDNLNVMNSEERTFFYNDATAPQWAKASSLSRIHDHTQTPQSVGFLWTNDQPLRRDLYLTTHNTHNRQISMPPAGFEPTIATSERPQTYALDCADTEFERTY
jgi:hypothetical protein